MDEVFRRHCAGSAAAAAKAPKSKGGVERPDPEAFRSEREQQAEAGEDDGAAR